MLNSAGRAYVYRKLAQGKTRSRGHPIAQAPPVQRGLRALQADLAMHEVSGEDNQAA